MGSCYIPVLRSGERPDDDKRCGVVYIYANTKAANLAAEIADFTVELSQDGNAAGSDVYAVEKSMINLDSAFFFGFGTPVNFPSANYDQAVKIRIYMYEPGTFTLKVKRDGVLLSEQKDLVRSPSGDSSFTVKAVAAAFQFEESQVLIQGAWDDQKVVFLKGQTVTFSTKMYIDAFGSPPATIGNMFPSFLNVTPTSTTAGTMAPNEEGDYAFPPVANNYFKFTSSSIYKFTKVIFSQRSGDYSTTGVSNASGDKYGMIEPVHIICPELVITGIKDAPQKDDGTDLAVFDDSAPSDEDPGTCKFKVEAENFPDLSAGARAIVWDMLEWVLPEIGLDAEVGTPDPTTPNLQPVLYDGMPENNSSFGTKQLTLRFKDRDAWKVTHDFEARFKRDGTGAADEHHAAMAYVAAGNPNWYVYWQQVADEYGFGPQSDVMKYESAKNSPEGGVGRYHPTSYVPWEDEMEIYDWNRQDIVECVKTIHHENGHRQSFQLPNTYGGWGSSLTYSIAGDGEDPASGLLDVIHKDFENAVTNDSFDITTNDRDDRAAWEHGWDAAGAGTDKINPDWETSCLKDGDGNYVQGLCAMREKEVEDKKTDIEAKDWSYETSPP